MQEALHPFPPDRSEPETTSGTRSSQIVPARDDAPVRRNHTATASAAGQGTQRRRPRLCVIPESFHAVRIEVCQTDDYRAVAGDGPAGCYLAIQLSPILRRRKSDPLFAALPNRGVD